MCDSLYLALLMELELKSLVPRYLHSTTKPSLRGQSKSIYYYNISCILMNDTQVILFFYTSAIFLGKNTVKYLILIFGK